MTKPLDKSAMRAVLCARRSAVPVAAAAAFATRLAEIGPQLSREHQAAVVSAYWSIGDEVVTPPLLEALETAGFTVALPVTGRIGEALIFRRWRHGDTMGHGRMQIPVPRDEAPRLDPDVLFVPLTGFDRRGQRIGYGAGFYDRTLAALRARKAIMAIGVGYADQEVPSVPYEAHDEPLDMIVTERELIVCAAAL